MPPLSHLESRRAQILETLEHPLLLMAGGQRSRNYPDNPYPFRPDSNFLFFFADPEPDAAALLDPADRTVTLFLHERTPEIALWHGAEPSFAEMQARHGVDRVVELARLQETVEKVAAGREVRSIAVADRRATALACRITGEDLDFFDAAKVGDPAVIQAIGRLRARKAPLELEAMRATARVTHEAHVLAIRNTRPGVSEQHLAGLVDGCFERHGCVPAYNTILSVRGEVLHNHSHANVVQEGDIVLLDAGAEAPSGYCSDVTRSWPGGGRLSPEGRDVYDTVLRAEKAAIDAAGPGVRYRDVHLLAARVIAEGLADMGLLQGDPDALVEAGAHAVFFPHGVGHLIGLDVHDMEAFGDAIAYPAGRTRSEQFGTAYLRLDMDLEPGIAFTIEPGVYFVPAILHKEELRTRFKGQVRFDRAEEFLKMNGGRGFGGIRIEDDVVVTADGREVLTAEIPKERGEIEELVGTAAG